MDDSSLADWISWGTGHRHNPEDIGQWHVGGKLAAIYLANSLEILCRLAGESTVYRFNDPNWGTRTNLLEEVKPEVLTSSELVKYPQIEKVGDNGFALLILRSLKPHRYESEILRSQLANTYRNLLEKGKCQIVVDGEDVVPFPIPESTTFKPILISKRLQGGLTVKGRIAVIDRERLEKRRGLQLSAGIRTVFGGRLIKDGESFGHNLSGRGISSGSLAKWSLNISSQTQPRMIGTKTAFYGNLLRNSCMQRCSPVVTFLNQFGESRQISREHKKLVAVVRRQVEDALKKLSRAGPGFRRAG